MRAGAAKAGMASAAMLLAPACGRRRRGEGLGAADEPVRRANFRSLAARDFLLGCAGGAARAETRAPDRSGFQELKRFARGKGADHALALGANDWAGLAPPIGPRALRAGRGAPIAPRSPRSAGRSTRSPARHRDYRGGAP